MGRHIDFRRPQGAPALVPAESISWRVFANPVTVIIGGITAVLLELAEPRVRTGVWEHSGFRQQPFARMKRTGIAAMITVYAPRETAEAVIAGVTRMHGRISGKTPDGAAYRAMDQDLLNWVQATAGYGFVESYSAYACSLSEAEKDQFYSEGKAAAQLYGALGAPTSLAGQRALFAEMDRHLEPSDILHEFLDLAKSALPLPGALSSLIIKAGVDLLPPHLIERLQLAAYLPSEKGRKRLRQFAKLAGAMPKPGAPATQACKRMGIRPY